MAMSMALLVACGGGGGNDEPDPPSCEDADGDGTGRGCEIADCNDVPSECGANCFVGNPAADLCDGYDNDCDGAIDENPDRSWYPDGDGDGFGAAGSEAIVACAGPEGYVDNDDDCDDDPGECGSGCFPGNFAQDICDGFNQDCDLATDEDPQHVWFADADGDGFGNAASNQHACTQPTGFVANDGDCDDDPGECGSGCFPGNEAADTCDGFNQDCDGATDENPEVVWYADDDGDSFGNAGKTQNACDQPVGYVSDDTDCDDDPGECGSGCFPGNFAQDICDGFNQDCDLATDEEPDLLWYADVDGDGFGDSQGSPTASCTAVASHVQNHTDCDDDPGECGAGCFPGNGAADVCDGHDQDCSGVADEDPEFVWYADDDGDTFGNAGKTQNACTQPVGYVSDDTDCDDDPSACGSSCFPGNSADDTCDGDNQDCDASVDEAPEIVWYADDDGDTFGNASKTQHACAQPDGYVSDDTDCDDNPSACGSGCFPGNTALDVCDNRNQDCDGSVDENPDKLFYVDADRDGFGDPSDTSPVTVCTATGRVANNSDCDDGHAGRWRLLSGVPDLDFDHHGDSSKLPEQVCAGSVLPPGFATSANDCDDSDPTRYVSAPELPDDGIDQDCANNGDLVPSDATGVFVDVSYDGSNGTSDGTMSAPYTKIQEGVFTARLSNKVVFVALGTYSENVTTPVSIFAGYDPSDWSKGGTTTLSAPSGTVITATSAIAIQDLSITGSGLSRAISGSGLVLDRVSVDLSNTSLAINGSGIIRDSDISCTGTVSVIAVRSFGGLTVLNSRIHAQSSTSATAIRTQGVFSTGTQTLLLNSFASTNAGTAYALDYEGAATVLSSTLAAKATGSSSAMRGDHGGDARIVSSILKATGASTVRALDTRSLSSEIYDSDLVASTCLVFAQGTENTCLTDIADVNACTSDACYSADSNISVDPEFVSYPDDLHLQSTSGCIDTGVDPTTYVSTTLPLTDNDGDARPFGAGHDIGADEYVP